MPTTQPDRQIVALVAAQGNVRANLTGQAVATASESAQAFTGWYDSARITEWAATLVLLIEALQRAVAASTDAYLARVLSHMLGRRVRPGGPVDITGLRRGVTHTGSYGRAADVYRWQQAQFDRYTRDLANNVSPQVFDQVDPILAAVQRVEKVADMDMQLAFQAQSRQVFTDAEQEGLITGWRRVIHPELSKGGSCGLCVAASDRLYGPQELMPLHSRCECTTIPAIEGADPGSALNRADLGRLYRQAGGTGREKLKAVRYKITDHGELGPLLNPKDAKIRTAAKVRRDTSRPGHVKTDAEKRDYLQRVRQSLTGSLPKAQVLAAGDSPAWGDYLGKLEARLADLDHQLAA